MSEKKRIMIVDDDPKNVKILKMLFQNTADLAVANNGEEALEKIPQFKPNLVLLDLMMPGIEGYEVCQWIKSDKRFCNTKVVIVSSRAMNHEFKRGFEVGANEYFSKPFDHDALVARVHELLDESTPEGVACNVATGDHEPTATGHRDGVMDQGQEPARILIVDDDSRNLKIVKLILMEHNYDLATAGTGSETLEKVAEFNPDLILLDVMMPDISGCEVAKRIKDNPATRQIPIIMLTAREADLQAPPEEQHLRLRRTEIFDPLGETRWRVTFEDYQVVPDPADPEGRGVALPFTVHFEDPVRGEDTRVRFKEIELMREAPDASVFTQEAPGGVTIEAL